MSAAAPRILTLNAGSSSIRFALFDAAGGAQVVAGSHAVDEAPALPVRRVAGTLAHGASTEDLLDALAAQVGLAGVDAIGHRVVHGMRHVEPERVTPALLADLRGIAPIDPEHLPAEIALIEALASRLPAVPQVACFDTAFHAAMPRVAQLLPIPRRYEAQGIRRYGFHGLSYAYLMEALARTAGEAAAHGRVVLAHLGSGASMAAVHGGRSVDTSMGFTPDSGLPMGTRSGDLDPGLAAYLERTERLSASAFFTMASHASGLLAVSGTSADMRELLAREASDVRAAEAVALFCYQAKKCVGAYAAVLGGIDTLVFSGGIGEHAAPVRARICEGLGFLGIAIDAARNEAHADVISTDASRATVRMIRTDEESMIARSVSRVLHLGT